MKLALIQPEEEEEEAEEGEEGVHLTMTTWVRLP